MVTVGRLQPGSIIGLASLLRGHPCEDVTAICELNALAIPDECIADLYRDEAGFRDWCQQQLWPAELIALMQAIQAQSPHADGSLQWLQQTLQQSKLISADEASITKAHESGLQLFGLNPSQPSKLAHPLDASIVAGIEIAEKRFEPRLIALPLSLVESIRSKADNTNGQPGRIAQPSPPRQANKPLNRPPNDHHVVGSAKAMPKKTQHSGLFAEKVRCRKHWPAFRCWPNN